MTGVGQKADVERVGPNVSFRLISVIRDALRNVSLSA